jgi:hypothetical protein
LRIEDEQGFSVWKRIFAADMETVSRLSINQYTVRNWTIPQLLEGCVAEQIPFVSLWRDKVAETGLDETLKLLGETGVKVSSLCRGGFFPAATLDQQSRNLGMVIDVYHVWWDPAVYSEIERASDHIFGFHVNDWIVPVPDMLNGRGIMGDGVIAIKRLREAVTQAGYNGPIEVEIFNEELWQVPGGELLRLIKDRFLQYV